MSKRYFMIAAAVAAIAAGPALATAAPAAAPASRAPAAAPATGVQQPAPLTRAQLIKNIDEQFKAIDTNGDGFLEPNEIAAAELKVQQRRVAEIRSRMEAEFGKLDTNRDGYLSKAEFMAAAPQPPVVAPDVTAAFERLDAKKDGKVTADEFRAAAAARFDQLDSKHAGVLSVTGPAGTPAKTLTKADFLKQADSEFSTIDTAHHGFVTKAEFAAAELRARQERVAQARSRMEAEFTKLNTSHNGQLSKAEFMAAAPQMPTAMPDPANILAQLDKNHDGKVSLDEYRAPVLARFDALDANHDGVIEPNERQAAQASKAAAPKRKR